MDKGIFLSSGDRDVNHLFWATGERKRAYKCPIFKINEVERFSQDGRKGKFIEVASPDWIVVIPVFRDEDGVLRVVMEDQYRHGSDSISREFPAGLVEEGEDALDGAKRELLEETGLEAGKWTLLGDVSPNPAFMTNRQYYFLAEELKMVSSQSLDANEEIDVLSLPLKEALQDIGKGLYDNGIMVAAAGFILQRANSDRSDLLS